MSKLAELIPPADERDDKAVRIARERYTKDTDDIEIDDIPGIARTDDGRWVAAWLWVSEEDIDEEP